MVEEKHCPLRRKERSLYKHKHDLTTGVLGSDEKECSGTTEILTMF